MDSRVVQSQVNENDENYPHTVVSQQVTHGAEDQHFDPEKKSVLNKVKAKAKKIKDTIKKHGHQVLDRGHEYNNEDQHTLDDHDLDEDEKVGEDPKVHETPIHESEAVKNVTPTSEQVENLGKSGINVRGTTVMGEEPNHDQVVEGGSLTTEVAENIVTDPSKAFSVEENAGLLHDNLEEPISMKDDSNAQGSRPEAYTPPNYQNKVIDTDPSGAGSDEIEITPVDESFARMNLHDMPKPTPEPNVQPTVVDSEYPPDGSHGQPVPHLSADPPITFSVEEKSGLHEDNLERPTGLKEDPHSPGSGPEAYTPPIFQTEVTDPNGAGSDEIEITPVEESFATMNVHDEPKDTQELNIQSTVVDSEYPSAGSHDEFVPHFSAETQTQVPSAGSHDEFVPHFSAETQTQVPSAESHDEFVPHFSAETQTQVPSAGSHDEFVPHFSAETQTQVPSAESHDEFSQEKISTNINRIVENPGETEQTFNTTTTTVGEQPPYEANTDKVVSPRSVITSELVSGEKGDINDTMITNEEQQKSGDTSNKSGSTAEYGKNIAQSLTEKLAPVYEKVAGVGNAVKSKVTGTSTGGVGNEAKNGVKEQDKGVSVKEYLAEKLKPGEEDKALSEVISEALHNPKEEAMKKEHEHLGSGNDKSDKVSEESSVNSQGKGVVGKLKGVVGSWFGKSENQSSQVAGEGVSNSTNYGAEVEQVKVNQVVDENSSRIEEQGTR
ncbi:low-temperature-induced 65 kDa protein [Abrus precatorius]|uniref:Low-temperature-induced 65 kDa protein n=1 Tax=Abrus precatorius TaxID=3816 RepID=A0A8B8MFB3_ABRPR|nr:low-temperature-induced 65 kDa protein [Abrus precatorius]